MSVLAAQLAQLARKRGPQEKWLPGKHSLLFTYQQAADISAETLLNIAQRGAAHSGGAGTRFKPHTARGASLGGVI